MILEFQKTFSSKKTLHNSLSLFLFIYFFVKVVGCQTDGELEEVEVRNVKG